MKESSFYTMKLELELPESPTNINMGMFMIGASARVQHMYGHIGGHGIKHGSYRFKDENTTTSKPVCLLH